MDSSVVTDVVRILDAVIIPPCTENKTKSLSILSMSKIGAPGGLSWFGVRLLILAQITISQS